MATRTENRVDQDVRGRLLNALGKVDRPGAFCVQGDRPVTMPGLQIDEIGTIGLPLTGPQARELAKHCHRAPYGKGTETVIDTDVRRVWELDPNRFRLANPNWDSFIDSVVTDVKQGLGLEKQSLVPHLYKLLLYEEGSFFLPHRDGEKLDGMVATLVVALPAVHEGGELIVTHERIEETIQLHGAASGFEISYAAFYADCEHEVRPVRQGHRLCLVYNLALKKTRGRKDVHAPAFGAVKNKVADVLSSWSADPKPEKLAVTLDHRYTQDGLSLDRLKGVDRARADVLFDAAEQAGCVAHLALVTLWQVGSAECDFYDRAHYAGFGDDDESFTDSASSYLMGEVHDDRLSADHWSERDGNKVALGEIAVGESEVVSFVPLEDWETSREDFEGYTGNAGMTLELWYHRAALVIWPRSRHLKVLCGAGTDAAIGGLQAMMRDFKRVPKARRDAMRQECVTFAEAIIDTWEVRPRMRWSATVEKSETLDRSEFPSLLCELDQIDLLRRFLPEVMTRDGDVGLGKSFVKSCGHHGWKAFEPVLREVVQVSSCETIPRNVQLLELLCVQRAESSDRTEVCERLCDLVVTSLVGFDEGLTDSDWQARQLARTEIVVLLVKAMLAVDADRPLRQFVDHMLASSDKYDLTDVQLPAICSLQPLLKKRSTSNAAVNHWLGNCRTELAARTAEAPQPPADFRRESGLSCSCGDCRRVSAFLLDPDREVLRLPLAKGRRQHLHHVINGGRCDLTHITERRGRPYTLVCMKTTASFEAALASYHRDLKHLDQIDRLIERIAKRT